MNHFGYMILLSLHKYLHIVINFTLYLKKQKFIKVEKIKKLNFEQIIQFPFLRRPPIGYGYVWWGEMQGIQ